MRVYDNASPEGRYVDTRDHRTYPQEQARISSRGTRPACDQCGWTLEYVEALRETDWRFMNPNSPTWERDTEWNLQRLANVKRLILENGSTIYQCSRCGLANRGKNYTRWVMSKHGPGPKPAAGKATPLALTNR